MPSFNALASIFTLQDQLEQILNALTGQKFYQLVKFLDEVFLRNAALRRYAKTTERVFQTRGTHRDFKDLDVLCKN
jgi:hypothetical protein